MRISGKPRKNIGLVIIGISLIAWVFLLNIPHHHVEHAHHHAGHAEMHMEPASSVWAVSAILHQLGGWGLMVVAMMLPKLIGPLRHIFASSLKRNRLPSMLIFASGYLAVWMVAGVPMSIVITAAQTQMPGSFTPALLTAFVALLWQFSPLKQACLNQGHVHKRLETFGLPAYSDALKFGISHGMWCVGSGWAIMLVPMLLPVGHNLAMIAVSVLMISEHMEHPRIPRWRLALPTRLAKSIQAQLQIRFGNFGTVSDARFR